MGILVNGVWKDEWYDTKSTGGRFVRWESRYRNWITPDGMPGPSGEGGFRAEPGRYHLYVSFACPWAHRTLILRALKGLESAISLSVTHWYMGENGWTFKPAPGVIPDPIHGADYLYQVYLADNPKASGRATTPVLWDKALGRIVNNESAEIMGMLNSAFDGVGAKPGDYYPEALRRDIDDLSERIYHALNNGVYRAGFATTQEAYEEAACGVFAMLDELEQRLANSRYLFGDQPLESDWRLFTTLIRFDAVYFGHFKCNLRRLIDYPNLFEYTRDLYQIPGVAETVNFDHIRRHYYTSHKAINPTGIVPIGPALDFSAPHGREALVSP
ncbi:MAG TPA: glutathione S-transferase family protein [Candidatus Binatia bacterium]